MTRGSWTRGSGSGRARRRPGSRPGRMSWGWTGGGPGMCSVRRSCRCCSRTASTTGPTRWCWRPRSTGGRMRASCRTCWPGCWTGTWRGSGSASPTGGSPRSCARSPTGPHTGWSRAARRRHVTVMAWDPGAAGRDPGVLARRAEIAYGAQVVLYPAPGGDHAALGRLLAGLAEDRFPSAAALLETYHDLRREHTAWLQRIHAVFFHQGARHWARRPAHRPRHRGAADGRCRAPVTGRAAADRPPWTCSPPSRPAWTCSAGSSCHRRPPPTGAKVLTARLYGAGPLAALAMTCWPGGASAAPPPPARQSGSPGWTSPSAPPTASASRRAPVPAGTGDPALGGL